MSKKRTKSPGTANAASGDNKWDSIITAAELNDNNWSYSLAVLAPNVFQDTETINYIAKAISGGLRRKFTLINEEKIMQTINEFGNPKAKKGKDGSVANSEVCEAAKYYVDKGEDIPADLKAKLIKWIMLNQKVNDVKLESPKKSDGKTSKAGGRGAKKGGGEKGGDRSASGKKGGQAGGKRSPEPPSVKIDSKLRKRGDPDPDIPYIDDEPDDGSSRYFILTGLLDTLMIDAMANINCAVTCVIRVTRDIHILAEEDSAEENAKFDGDVNEEVDKGSEHQREEEEAALRSRELAKFWKDLNEVLVKNKMLLDTPILSLEAKHLMFPIDKEDEEMTMKCAMELFEMTAVLMYDVLDMRRQWQNYMNKSKLISIPQKVQEKLVSQRETARNEDMVEDPQSTSRPETSKEHEETCEGSFNNVDMDYYHFVLRDAPMHSCSIYLQMSAMLDQVEVSLGDKQPDYKEPDSVEIKDLSETATHLLTNLTNHIYMSNKQKQQVLKEMGMIDDSNRETNQEADDLKSKSAIHTLDRISIFEEKYDKNNKISSLQRELKVLVQSFRHLKLMDFPQLDDDVARKRAARTLELLNYIDNNGLSKLEIDYAIRVFLLESLTITSTDENGIIFSKQEEGLIGNKTYQVWDDPFMIKSDDATNVIEKESKFIKKKLRDQKTTSMQETKEEIESDKGLTRSDSENIREGILKSSARSSSVKTVGSRSRSQSPQIANSSRRKSSVRFDSSVIVNDGEYIEESVHPEEEEVGIIPNEEMGLIGSNNTYQDILREILENIRKRSFTEWCFEEFYEPHVLFQIIHQAIYKLPFVDLYPLRQSNRKLLVLNNPYREDIRVNYQCWEHWLHSNVGFRNYLKHVAEKIRDWTRDEEAIYQAQLLSKEIESEKSETENEASEKEVPKKGKKTPVKGRKSARSRSTSQSSGEEANAGDEFSLIVPGSLKAQKMEKDKLNRQKEEEERKKEEKRQLSARKKAEKETAKSTDKEGKRPSSKSSSKSKSRKSEGENACDAEKEESSDSAVVQADEYWPFISYDLGDNPVHFTGEVTHMFPDDGNTIRIFRSKNVTDKATVRFSLITNSNTVLSVHTVDMDTLSASSVDGHQSPEVDNENEAINIDGDAGQSLTKYSSVTCMFHDGLCIASTMHSDNTFLPTDVANISTKSHDEKSEELIQSPKSGDSIGAGNTDSKNNTDTETFVWNDISKENYQNIMVSTPNGVQVQAGYKCGQKELLLKMNKRMGGKMSGQSSNSGVNGEDIEVTRYITSDGNVICVYSNDVIKILYPNGSTGETTLTTKEDKSVAVDVPVTSEQETDIMKEPPPTGKKKRKPSKLQNEIIAPAPVTTTAVEPITTTPESKNQIRLWKVTSATGDQFTMKTSLADMASSPTPQIKTMNLITVVEEDRESKDEESKEESIKDDKTEQKEKEYLVQMEYVGSQLVSSATDPSTNEVMITREDQTVSLSSPETATEAEAGIYLCEHADGTRFTKYSLEKPGKKGKEEVESMEIAIHIESRDYPSVLVNLSAGSMETRFGSMGILISDCNGCHLYKHSDLTEIEYRQDGEIVYLPPPPLHMSYLQPYGSNSYVINPDSPFICQLFDGEGTEYLISNRGEYQINKSSKAKKKAAAIAAAAAAESAVSSKKDGKSTSAISMGSDKQDNSYSNVVLKKYDQHAPRIFVINPDYSGSELLRYRDIIEYLQIAEMNEEYVEHKEELQDAPQVNTISVFHPIIDYQPWQNQYTRKSILPAGLISRDLKTLPTDSEINKNFGTDQISMGKGNNAEMFTMSSVWKRRMLYRQLYHYPILTEDIRSMMKESLLQYNQVADERNKYYQEMEIVDPRSEEELNQYQQIQKLFLTKQRNEQVLNNAVTHALRQDQPLDQQYSDSRPDTYSNAQSQMIHDDDDDDDDLIANEHETFEDDTMSEKQTIIADGRGKKLDIILERIRMEKDAEVRNKEALRNKEVPNYFKSIYGKDFVSTQALDLQTLNKVMKIYPSSREQSVADKENIDDKKNKETVKDNDETSKEKSDKTSTFSDKDVYQISTAMDESLKFGDKPIFRKKKKDFVYYDSSLILPEIPKRVPSNETAKQLKLPSYMFAQRSSINQNIRQIAIEDPVRRRVLTSSMVGGSKLGQLFQRQTRGLDVLPHRIDMGLIREGRRLTHRIQLINTGPEPCRFRIRQPPSPQNGVWVEFVPGSIPAGLSRNINVFVYGICSDPTNSVSSLDYNLIIDTDTDILKIPITAKIMPGDTYDQIYAAETEDERLKRRQTITLNK